MNDEATDCVAKRDQACLDAVVEKQKALDEDYKQIAKQMPEESQKKVTELMEQYSTEKLEYTFKTNTDDTEQLLEQAKQEWQSKKFPKVPGDETYIPFP